MELQQLLSMISGSDVRGIAISDDPQKIELSPDIASIWAQGFVAYLEKQGISSPRISVGMDSRISGPSIKFAIVTALVQSGATVVDCQLCTTPAMFMTTVTDSTHCHGAIMITASHHPFDRNGLKFFTNQGGLEKATLAEMATLALSSPILKSQGSVETYDFLSEYVEILANVVRKGVDAIGTFYQTPLDGFHIVVDAGNGVGGFFCKVLESLGAKTIGSQFIQPDGMFPNHVPNPEDREAMASITQAVMQNGADLGLIFDADCDRAGAVLGDGSSLNRNRLIALMSAVVLENHPGATIVTDSVTSEGLATFIMMHGGIHRRFKRGYKNIIGEMQRLNSIGDVCPLAMETSGHAAFADNYALDDGAYLCAQLLILLGRQTHQRGQGIASLLYSLQEPEEALELRLPIVATPFAPIAEAALKAVEAAAKTQFGARLADDSAEGVRVYLPEGFYMIRLSVHDPVLPINIESRGFGGALSLGKALLSALHGVEGVDLSPLENAVHKPHS